jgi:hypothetical protein
MLSLPREMKNTRSPATDVKLVLRVIRHFTLDNPHPPQRIHSTTEVNDFESTTTGPDFGSRLHHLNGGADNQSASHERSRSNYGVCCWSGDVRYFDSDSGKQEILAPRIGVNEATAIQVCEEFATAENHGNAKAATTGPIAHFVESLVSGGANNNRFQGYYFRVVTVNSTSGVSDSKRTAPRTLVAYPADYRDSGIIDLRGHRTRRCVRDGPRVQDNDTRTRDEVSHRFKLVPCGMNSSGGMELTNSSNSAP